jgi:hypothetical protein
MKWHGCFPRTQLELAQVLAALAGDDERFGRQHIRGVKAEALQL